MWAGLERFVCVGRVRMFCVWAGLERFVLVAFRESLVLFQNSSSQFDKFVSDFPLQTSKRVCVWGGGGGGGKQSGCIVNPSTPSFVKSKAAAPPLVRSQTKLYFCSLQTSKDAPPPLLTSHPHLRVKQSHTAPFGIPGKATPLFIPKESGPVPSR